MRRHHVPAFVPALDAVVGEWNTGGGALVGALVVNLHCECPCRVPLLDGQLVLAVRRGNWNGLLGEGVDRVSCRYGHWPPSNLPHSGRRTAKPK